MDPDNGRDFNNNIVTMTWALNFARAQEVHDQMMSEKIYVNDKAKAEIQNRMSEQIKTLNVNQIITFGNLKDPVQVINATYLQHRTVENYPKDSATVIDFLFINGLDDMFAALGNFEFRMAVEGEVKCTFIGIFSTKYEFTIKKVGVYIRDSYDFTDSKNLYSQYLGCWHLGTNKNGDTNMVSVGDCSGTGDHPVSNYTFREWRERNGCGGDFIVFSDVEVTVVNASWSGFLNRVLGSWSNG